jgi:hypothetical protein
MPSKTFGRRASRHRNFRKPTQAIDFQIGPRAALPPHRARGVGANRRAGRRKLDRRQRTPDGTSDYDMVYQGEEAGLLVFHFDTREKLPYDYLYTPEMKLSGIRDAQKEYTFDPAVGYVDFPLYVGKAWKVTYKSISNSSHSMGETQAEVLAFESVMVPYGKVDAFRIRVRNSDRGVSRMNPTETFWFSPEIGYYVKHETTKPVYEDPFELIAVSK